MRKTKHDADCGFFSALDNGTPDCGVCTCGLGLQRLREDAGVDDLYSEERIRSITAIQDGEVDKMSVTKWSLELTIKHKPNLRRLIHWLYQEEVFDFHWEHRGGTPDGDIIILTIEGCWPHNLKEIAQVLGDYDSSTTD